MTNKVQLTKKSAWRVLLVALAVLFIPLMPLEAQNEVSAPENTDEAQLKASAGPSRQTLVGRNLSFSIENSTIPESAELKEVRWDFGDGSIVTGDKATHTYVTAGTYQVRLEIRTSAGTSADTTEVKIFERLMVLVADNTATEEQLSLSSQQAAAEDLLLLIVRAKSSGPEALVEEELTQALLTARKEVDEAHVLTTLTSGSVGANVLSRFAQESKQIANPSSNELNLRQKGIVILTTSSFTLLSPTVQSMFDRLEPSYAVLTRPDVLPLLFPTTTADEARDKIVGSPIPFRLIGTFSSRAVTSIGATNFLSVGINYLINAGIPVNNILLVLMIPIIATILAFARQVVGIKAFGLITPAMTTLAFLVLGLANGLLVFVVVLLSGSLSRAVLRRLRLLYLPRMALVLTAASLAMLVLFGATARLTGPSTVSFSIFPILMLIILAEEFVAVQFSRGLKPALRITTTTLLLAIVCYFITSWELLRTSLLAYPELILLTIPLNIALGRFTGLRLTEYLRFRQLIRTHSS